MHRSGSKGSGVGGLLRRHRAHPVGRDGRRNEAEQRERQQQGVGDVFGVREARDEREGPQLGAEEADELVGARVGVADEDTGNLERSHARAAADLCDGVGGQRVVGGAR